MASGSASKGVRDRRLDVWRGLCLLDMVVVHLLAFGLYLGEFATRLLGDHLRFAAGGFIFVAGLSVATIFLPRFQRDPLGTARRLVRRAGVVLGVHYLLETAALIHLPLLGQMTWAAFADAMGYVLRMQSGNDLLPFYVVMLLATPAILWTLCRVGGGTTLPLVSLGLYAWGWWGDAANAYRWGFDVQQTFPVVLWQTLYVAGILCGAYALPRWDAMSVGRRAGTFVTFTASSAVVSWLTYLVATGDERSASWFFSAFWFYKVPLGPGEALRYLTIILTLLTGTNLLWTGLLAAERRSGWASGAKAVRAVLNEIATLGRHALPAYVLHVWVVAAGLWLATNWQAGPALSGGIVVLTLGLLLVGVRTYDGVIRGRIDPIGRLAGAWWAAIGGRTNQPGWPRRVTATAAGVVGLWTLTHVNRTLWPPTIVEASAVLAVALDGTSDPAAGEWLVGMADETADVDLAGILRGIDAADPRPSSEAASDVESPAQPRPGVHGDASLPGLILEPEHTPADAAALCLPGVLI